MQVEGKPRVSPLGEDPPQVPVVLQQARAREAGRELLYDLIDLVVLEPGVDGLELARKARKQNPEIRVIMVTGNTTVDIDIRLLRYGIDGYIKKPFNISKLRKVVRQTLCIHKIVLKNV